MSENKLFVYMIYLLAIFIIWGTSAAVAVRLGEDGIMVAPMSVTIFYLMFKFILKMEEIYYNRKRD